MSTKKEKPPIKEVTLEAVGLEIQQGPVPGGLFVFVIDGKTIAKQLGVRKMKWHSGKLQGFQRQLDKNRVQDIAQYLSKNPILPNALVVAFQEGTLEFKPLPNQVPGQPKLGSIHVRGKVALIDGEEEAAPEDERVGYVIDGQHRLKAIEDSTLKETEFPVIVSAFHAVETRFQLEQFYALNQTVQIGAAHIALLRRQLGYELPHREAYKKAISDVTGILQEMKDSPFQPEKHISVPKIYSGPLSITVLEAMIDRAVKITNLKFHWKQNASEIPVKDLQHIAKCLYIYWKGVSEVFAEFWGRKPKDQRPFSAIGLYAMIMFYDRVMSDIDLTSQKAVAQVKKKLDPIHDLPWGKMGAIPSTPKSTFRPEHLFDAVNELWQNGNKRPYTFNVRDPISRAALVNVDLQ